MTALENERLNKRRAVPASQYTHEELAEIYNQTRVDYIVPMPMNARRMAEYVKNYDVDLDLSIVAFNDRDEEAGIGMVGIRGHRCWLTRLGVVPNNRGLRMGQYLMEAMLEKASDKGATQAQLEVIVGNEPAHNLFLKLGFEDVRKLLIVRRPPGKIEPNPVFDTFTVTEMTDSQIPFYLEQRNDNASWVEETDSILNAGSLRGLIVESPAGERGWVAFQRTPFQLTHFVFSPYENDTIYHALLYHVHKTYPMQDTKIENVPEAHPRWRAYQQMGYMEVFARTEMTLSL